MGCCPGANGNTSELKLEIAERRPPTLGAEKILRDLMDHLKVGSSMEVFSKGMARLGLNDAAWGMEVETSYKRFVNTGVLPQELISLHSTQCVPS